MINGGLGIVMCGFTFSSSMQFAPLVTRCATYTLLRGCFVRFLPVLRWVRMWCSRTPIGSHLVNSSNCLDWVGSKTMSDLGELVDLTTCKFRVPVHWV